MQKKIQILILVSSALAIFYFNYASLIPALNTIIKALSFTSEYWVINMFYIGVVPFVIIAGRVTDYFGTQRIFALGSLLFFIGSLASAVAHSQILFLLGRFFQGAGYAFLFPSTGTLTTRTSPPHERGKFIGLYLGIAVLFSPIGTVLGGLIVTYSSWREIFFVQAIWALLQLIFGILSLPTDRGSKELRINVPCATLFGLGLITLITGIMEGNNWGWSSFMTLSLILIGVLFLTAFYFWNRASKHPHINFRLIRHPLAIASIMTGFIFAGTRMVIYFWGVMLEQAFSFSAASIGWILLFAMLPSSLLSPLGGTIFQRLGAKITIFLACALTILYNVLIAIGSPIGSLTLVIAALLVYGISFPFVYTPSTALLYAHTDDRFRGKISSIYMLGLQLGSTVVFAVLAAFFRFSESFSYPSDIKNPGMMGIIWSSAANAFLVIPFCFLYLWLDRRSQRIDTR